MDILDDLSCERRNGKCLNDSILPVLMGYSKCLECRHGGTRRRQTGSTAMLTLSHENRESAVPPPALDSYAASTRRMVLSTSSTPVSSTESSPPTKRCKLLIGPMKASGNHEPANARVSQSRPSVLISNESGCPFG